jgi:HSP20 family molecular chaperone IbpA
MPGVGVENIDLTLERNLLTLRGRVEDTEDQGASHTYREYEVGDYVRSFKLSGEVDRDGINAVSKHGVLTLTLPKVGSKLQQIEVTSG